MSLRGVCACNAPSHFPARNLPIFEPTSFFVPYFFATKDVTLPRLHNFSVDAIQRLGLDNPSGVFTALTARYTALFGA